jgi:amidase
MESAAELARSVAAGERTAGEVVDAHLAVVESLNPRLNALTRVLDSPLGDGLLAGVPFSVKENVDLAGTPTTFGLRGDIPDAASDAPSVAHLRAAGALGLPALSPPNGTQPITSRFNEALLLDLAAQLAVAAP